MTIKQRPHLKGKGALAGPRIVLERRKCAALIGAIAAQWARTEQQLATIYAVLVTGTEWDNLKDQVIAHESFELMHQSKAKFDLITSAAKERLDNKLSEKVRKLMKRYTDAAHDRNIVVHGNWFVAKEHPRELIWTRTLAQFQNAEVWGLDHFESVLNHLEELDNDVGALYQELLPELVVSRQSLVNRLPGPKNVKNRD